MLTGQYVPVEGHSWWAPEGKRAWCIRDDAPVLVFGAPERIELLRPTLTVTGGRDCGDFGTTLAKSAASIAKRLSIPISTGCDEGAEETVLTSALASDVPVVLHVNCAPENVTPRQRGLIEAVTAGGGLAVTGVPPGTAPTKTNRMRSRWLMRHLAAPLLLVQGDLGSEAFDLAVNTLIDGGPLVVPLPGPNHRRLRSLRALSVLAGLDPAPRTLAEELLELVPHGDYANAVCRDFDELLTAVTLFSAFGRNHCAPAGGPDHWF